MNIAEDEGLGAADGQSKTGATFDWGVSGPPETLARNAVAWR